MLVPSLPLCILSDEEIEKISQGYDRPVVSHFDGAADMQVRFKQVGIDVGRRAKFVERCGNPL